MTYYLGKAFWLLAAPTSALILISAGAGLFAALGNSGCAAWLSATAACGLVIGAFTLIGLALAVPLENRFPFSQPDPQLAPDGIIMLPGGGGDGIGAVSQLANDFSKARLTFCGFGPSGGKNLARGLAAAGIDASPKPTETWLLITSAMHMPRAVGCFRAAGFQVRALPVEFVTRGRPDPFALFVTGSSALIQLDKAAKEWIGLIAYRLMGKTDALFPGP